jgi:hypothetical protein
MSNNAHQPQTKIKRMQLEFTKLITQTHAAANNRKPAVVTNKKPNVTRQQRKHIAEQFEFSFVRQLIGSAKPSLAA